MLDEERAGFDIQVAYVGVSKQITSGPTLVYGYTVCGDGGTGAVRLYDAVGAVTGFERAHFGAGVANEAYSHVPKHPLLFRRGVYCEKYAGDPALILEYKELQPGYDNP